VTGPSRSHTDTPTGSGPDSSAGSRSGPDSFSRLLRRYILGQPISQASAEAALDALLADLQRLEESKHTLGMKLDAERHNHHKDNEYLLSRVQRLEDALRGIAVHSFEKFARDAALAALREDKP